MSLKFSVKKCTRLKVTTKTFFVFVAPAKNLKDQVRRISNLSEIVCQINQEIAKTSKNNTDSSLTNVFTVGEDLLRAFCRLFHLRFCVSSDQ